MVGFPVKRDFAILYASMLVSRVGFGVIIILFPEYIKGASDVAVATALALYPLLEAATALPLGRFCDTAGRKVVFVASLGYVALLMASIGLTTNLYIIAAIHAMMGIGAAGVAVSTLTMLTDLTGVANRGKGMGGFDFANVGGYGVGIIVGYPLRTYFAADLGYAFAATAAIIGGSFAFGALLLKEPMHERRAVDRSLNPLRALDSRSKAILPIWFGVTILLGMVFFLPRAFSGAGIGSGQTAAILLAGLVVLGLGAVGWGALSDVIGRGKVTIIGAVGVMGLLGSLALTNGLDLHLLIRNLPLLGVFALMTSAIVPSILATAGDRAMLDRRGSAMGLYSVMLSGGSAFGTLLAGVVHSKVGLSGIFESAAGLFAVACLVSLFLLLRSGRRDPEQTL